MKIRRYVQATAGKCIEVEQSSSRKTVEGRRAEGEQNQRTGPLSRGKNTSIFPRRPVSLKMMDPPMP